MKHNKLDDQDKNSLIEHIKDLLVLYSNNTGIAINYELLRVALVYVSVLKDLIVMADKLLQQELDTSDLIRIMFDDAFYK